MEFDTESRHPGPYEPALPQSQISPVQLRVLQAAAAAGDDATIPHLAQQLGGHPNTTRAHLETLVEHDLIRREIAPATGRGRPRYIYRLTKAGVGALRPGPIAPEFAGLALALANYLSRHSDRVALDAQAAGRAWAEREDDEIETASTRLDVVTDKLATMGFEPEATTDEKGSRVLLRACPLLAAAAENTQVICNVHLGLLQGALAKRDLPSDDIELFPMGDPHGCVVRLGD